MKIPAPYALRHPIRALRARWHIEEADYIQAEREGYEAVGLCSQVYLVASHMSQNRHTDAAKRLLQGVKS